MCKYVGLGICVYVFIHLYLGSCVHRGIYLFQCVCCVCVWTTTVQVRHDEGSY